MNGIRLYDHIIVGQDGTYSYFLVGRMEEIRRKFDIAALGRGETLSWLIGRKFRLEPAFLQRWGNVLIFCLLIFVEVLLIFGSMHAVYFVNVRAWWVVVPVCVFLGAENAVKIWVLHTFREKIACYVLDTLCLIVLTVFTDGALISTLYIIILSEFYLGQKNMAAALQWVWRALCCF